MAKPEKTDPPQAPNAYADIKGQSEIGHSHTIKQDGYTFMYSPYVDRRDEVFTWSRVDSPLDCFGSFKRYTVVCRWWKLYRWPQVLWYWLWNFRIARMFFSHPFTKKPACDRRAQ